MKFPSKPNIDLTEKQRQEAEERFLRGDTTQNSTKASKTATGAGNAEKSMVYKTYVLKLEQSEYLKAKFHAAELGIPVGKYYEQAVKEKNQKMGG